MKTENATRLEIETGKGGVLLICSRLSPTQAKELASLFRRNCLDGQVIFVLNDHTTWPLMRMLLYRTSKGPEAIVQALSSGLRHQQA
jgi:hypothetical protein